MAQQEQQEREKQHQSDPSVRLIEVGPRDGLQNIAQSIPTATKLDLIARLRACGLDTIELTSVVSPRAVPQLADCRDILSNASIQALLSSSSSSSSSATPPSQSRFPVLVPNLKGFQISQSHSVREVAIFTSATEGFSKANTNRTVAQGIAASAQVAAAAQKAGVAVRGYLSCIFADPYTGPTPLPAVLDGVKALLDMGCYEVSLGDTLGVGTPARTRELLAYLVENGVPLGKLAGHFHDTYGQALANVWEAYNCGVRAFDSSVAGLGGCPFAPGAKGNVATEDLVYMFHDAGVRTGVDLDRLVDTGVWISGELSKANGSRAGAALAVKKDMKIAKSKAGGMAVTQMKETTPTQPLQWREVTEGVVDGLKLHKSGVNLKITMDRPRNGNALTSAMLDALLVILKSASADPTISRIIIIGSGKFFCSGMDLGKATAVGAKSAPPASAQSDGQPTQFTRLRDLFHAIDTSPKVTIACINGPAFGGGVGLALSCDLRICAPNATLTLSEVKLGLSAATISKYVVRELGVSFSREALLTARPITPAELKSRGVVMSVAKDIAGLGELLDETLRSLRIASPDGSTMSKDLVNLAYAHGGSERQDVGIKNMFDDMMRPGAAGEYGVKEFQAKRKVDWDALVESQNAQPVRSKL